MNEDIKALKHNSSLNVILFHFMIILQTFLSLILSLYFFYIFFMLIKEINLSK